MDLCQEDGNSGLGGNNDSSLYVVILNFGAFGAHFHGFSAVHPEMQYLQQEMIKQRDKRLELALRKCSYEIGNATKCRRADEDGVWSWWKIPLLTLSEGSKFSFCLVFSLQLMSCRQK